MLRTDRHRALRPRARRWRRGAAWALAGLALAIALLALSGCRSRPGAYLIERVFAHTDAAANARLAAHVPPGIEERLDLAYGPGVDERMDLYRPAAATAPLPVVVWVHGGGWVGGSRQTVANYLRILAGHGYATVAVGYSTARPGARYPLPLHQVGAALAHLVGHAAELGIDPDRIVLGGSSAGAQIASQLAMLATDPAYADRVGIAPTIAPARLRGMLLLSGAFDLPERERQGWFVDTVLRAYSGMRDYRTDPAFMLMAITPHVGPAFPPAFVSSGNGDPLAPQAEAFAARLQALGVEVDSLFFAPDLAPPLPHEFQFDLDRDEGRQTLARMLAFMARRTGEESKPAEP